MQPPSRRLFLASVCITPLTVTGCLQRVEPLTSPFVISERDYVLAFVLDLSGSFSERMHEDNTAYKFFLSVSDRYFRNRIGSNDRLVLAQLSADDHTLLWDGAPGDLRKRFGSAGEFREFVDSHADPAASPVHLSLSKTLDYITTMNGVNPQKTQLLVVVLSDMLDTSGSADRDAMETSLRKFGQYPRSALGLYFVDQDLTGEWRDRLKDCGVEHFHVEADIVDSPDLPEFE